MIDVHISVYMVHQGSPPAPVSIFGGTGSTIAQAHQAPPPAPVQTEDVTIGGVGTTIAQSMAFGAGGAVVHRSVDAVMEPQIIQNVTVVSLPSEATYAPKGDTTNGMDPCNIHSKAFQDCINNCGSDIGKCQFYLDVLNECPHAASAAVL